MCQHHRRNLLVEHRSSMMNRYNCILRLSSSMSSLTARIQGAETISNLGLSIALKNEKVQEVLIWIHKEIWVLAHPLVVKQPTSECHTMLFRVTKLLPTRNNNINSVKPKTSNPCETELTMTCSWKTTKDSNLIKKSSPKISKKRAKVCHPPQKKRRFGTIGRSS